MRWLTGFSGSNGWVVVTPSDVILGTDGRYGDRAVAETDGTGASVIAETSRVRLHERLVESVAGCRTIGLDPASTTQSAWTSLAADLTLSPVGIGGEGAPRGEGRRGDRSNVRGGGSR